jgi:NAD(P)-binding Rossmann-like domain
LIQVLIIGAGTSGLCAGYELKKAGFDVQILEASSCVGGRVKTFKDPFFAPGLQPLQWLNPLLTGQLTWQFPVFDGPSKLSWDLSVAVVDGLADQGIIPILYILAESYRWVPFSILNWLAKNYKRGTYSIWYRQADLEESPLSTDQPGWYLTHLVWAGQTSKILTINIPASLISNLSYTG